MGFRKLSSAVLLSATLILAGCGTVKKTVQKAAPAALDRQQAEVAAKPFLPAGADYVAFGYVAGDKSKIVAVCINAEGLPTDQIRLCNLSENNGVWVKDNVADYPFQTIPSVFGDNIGSDYAGSVRSFVDSITFSSVPEPAVNFNVLEKENGGRKRIYSACVYKPETFSFNEAVFEGKETGDGSNGYAIEGRLSPIAGGEIAALKERITGNKGLVAMSEADFLGDEVTEWWTVHNPDAMTSARKISMPVLPEGCSLMQQFAKSKYTASSSKYKVAMFDYRGNTSVVAYSKADNNYLLVWTEPECKDHKNGRLLNDISFENGLLVMAYYQGKKYFKYKINVTAKTISR